MDSGTLILGDDHVPDLSVINDNAPDYGDELLTGQDGYSNALVMRYLYNFWKHTQRTSPTAYRFCVAVERAFDCMIDGFPQKKDKKNHTYPDTASDPGNRVSQEEWGNLGAQLKDLSNMPADMRPDRGLANLRDFAGSIKLSAIDTDILEFALLYERNGMLAHFFQVITREKSERRGVALARMTDRPSRYLDVSESFDADRPLTGHGLLIDDPEDPKLMPPLDPRIKESVHQEGYSAEQVNTRIKGPPLKTDLTLEDWDHLADDIAFIVQRLKAAIRDEEEGVSILIYGPSGEGKTELAKAIAEAVGTLMFAVGENKDKHTNPRITTATRRMNHLKQLLALSGGSEKIILLLDELEDVLIKSTDTSTVSDTEDKVDVNRTFERNRLPVISTANDIKFHPSFLQRFTYSLYVGPSPTLVRQKKWAKQCALNDFTMSADDTLSLARYYAAPARLIGDAVKSAKKTGGGIPDIRRSLETGSKLLHDGDSKAIVVKNRVPDGFTLAGINAGDDTEGKINDLIRRGKNGSFSLFIEGPEGAGARSTMRYIGERLSMNMAEHSMKDLARPSTSKTAEMKIGEAFANAAMHRQLLVISDLEYLKHNPDGGKWDLDLTDAFLKAAQKHAAPFAATTHRQLELPGRLAFVFTDPMELKPLKQTQLEGAYKRSFGRAAPDKLSAYKTLVPGDFAAVAGLVKRYGAEVPANPIILSLFDKRINAREDTSAMGFGGRFVISRMEPNAAM